MRSSLPFLVASLPCRKNSMLLSCSSYNIRYTGFLRKLMPTGNAVEHVTHRSVMHKALSLVLMKRPSPTLFCAFQQ